MTSSGNCRCGQGGHAGDLRPEPEAAKELRASLLAAKSRGDTLWRGLSIASLFAPGGGKMFGVMRARAGGEIVWRYAFSGQIERKWIWPGWVGPIFDAQAWMDLESKHDAQIKVLTERIKQASPGSAALRELKQRRKAQSHQLLDAYLDLYQVHALNGSVAPIRALFGGRPPTGAGDCCAPKLLAAAVREDLSVLGISEIFLGASPRSGARVCGEISVPCTPKCVPMLDFILCPAAEHLHG